MDAWNQHNTSRMNGVSTGGQNTPAGGRSDFSRGGSRQTPIRVILMAESGEMYTVWLPPYVEGRYRFLDSYGLDSLPFYIEAEKNRWIVHTGANALFIRYSSTGEEVPLGRSAPLANKVFQYIRADMGRFAIYAENEYPGDYTLIPYYLE
jgi:hypothetical protein